ncbi:xanthine dehydrogenase family protein molybdopterin-binding subunit [Cereibacter sphaeroides]|jgi:xanthine dehydrogenase YagR molybdenum-binding subunit|uniref:xanthine dehydrogenase family protein molybdopterin-binding subunit n=1 Tax=Cereibacter sphaeroides TaxID=1063 RepID=UPI0000664F83|nr:xanthine dehydrogenase, molybdenum binding subunit apoprotein [Cereibacter sphaeroides ATCC 17029]
MTAHLVFDEPDKRNRLDAMAQEVVGRPIDRSEGALKVSGRAVYAAEQASSLWSEKRADCAYGVFVRATVPLGRVASLASDAARAVPGVLKVLQDPRLVRHPAQGMARKSPPQDPSEVTYFGQPLALVVAESFEAAREAARLVRVDYETSATAQLDPAQAPSEFPEKKQSEKGDLEAALREAAVSLDATYSTPSMAAAAMEPHAALAWWEGDRVTLCGAYQMVSQNAEELADALGIAPGKVRVLAPFIGGGFGSKLGIAPEAVAAAVAAEMLGRPVMVTLARQQEFEIAHRRSETGQRVRLALDADGRLTGIGHEARVSNLDGESFSEPVQQATHFTYRGEHRQIRHEVARVNLTCAGSVRAPGEAVGVSIFEMALDELAEKAGLDPLELRLRNIPEEDPETGKPFTSHMLAEALRDGADRFGWSDRRAPGERRQGEWLIGMGMASAVRVNMLHKARVRVTLTGEGALVESSMTDIGTGTYTILTQIVAEMLGLAPDRVRTVLGDTDLPEGSGSGGSIGAASNGSAAFLACEEIRRQIAAGMGCPEEELTLKDGRATCGNRTRDLAEIVTEPLSAEGHFEPGKALKGVRSSTFGAHFAEVAVNEITGEVRVRRMLGVFAAGRILNEKTARSQCLGGMTFGIGMALMEEMVHDRRFGQVVSRDLANYHIPAHADVPALEVHFLEERDSYGGTLQAKGIGELGICGSGAAVLNAIHNACGVRVRDLPATPDKVLNGLCALGR